MLRSAEPITGPPWVLRKFRTHAGIAPCLGYPAFSAEVRSDVLQASRSSCIALVVRVCQHRWIRPYLHFTALGAGPNVSSHLPLGSPDKPAGLGFTQCSIRHTRLALTTHRIGDFLLRGRPRMLWSPSSFEGRGKRGVHGTFHQFQYHLVRSKSAADAAHCRTPVALGAQRSVPAVKGGIARAPGSQKRGSGHVAWAQTVERSNDQMNSRAWCNGRAFLDFHACDWCGILAEPHGRQHLW